MKKTALAIHAGAGAFPKDLSRAKIIQKKLRELAGDGYVYLKKHTAKETAVEIVRWLEDWPETNAGTGSVLQSDGRARLSASLMDGPRMRFSGVVNIEQIKNPILVSALLQKEPDRLLAAEGAQQFAREKGFKLKDPRTQKRIEQWKTWLKKHARGKFGTVGVCTLDSEGRLAVATSTGGKGMERAGRVSDSALPAGNYANSFAAVSATGLGEDIIEEALASTIAVRALDLKNLAEAFRKTFVEARKRKRLFAAIGVDRNGKVMTAKTTEILYYAFWTQEKSGVFH